jgi:hypothetical protein
VQWYYTTSSIEECPTPISAIFDQGLVKLLQGSYWVEEPLSNRFTGDIEMEEEKSVLTTGF